MLKENGCREASAYWPPETKGLAFQLPDERRRQLGLIPEAIAISQAGELVL